MSVCLPPSRLECRRAPQCGPLCWSRTPQTGCTSPLQTSQQSLNCLGCNQTSAYFVHKHLLGRDLEILIIHIVRCTVSVQQVYSHCTVSVHTSEMPVARHWTSSMGSSVIRLARYSSRAWRVSSVQLWGVSRYFGHSYCTVLHLGHVSPAPHIGVRMLTRSCYIEFKDTKTCKFYIR